VIGNAGRPEVGRGARRARGACWSRFGPALLAGLALVSGCATSTVPPVPAVDDARAVSGAEPCALLTREQASALGLGPGASMAAPEGPRCEWRGASGLTLGVTLYADGDGLATLAENSEPTTTRVRLDGYPALETFTAGGEFCQYDVGVAADQVVMASLEAGTPDSCTALQNLLPSVFANLPRAPADR
jgi:hypothetical protein